MPTISSQISERQNRILNHLAKERLEHLNNLFPSNGTIHRNKSDLIRLALAVFSELDEVKQLWKSTEMSPLKTQKSDF